VAAYFFDIDGTLVEYHTNRWLPGALARIIKLLVFLLQGF